MVASSLFKAFTEFMARDAERTLDDLEKIYNQLDSVMQKISGSKSIDNFTYSYAIKYFVEMRPADPRITHGAILKDVKAGRKTVFLVFLDDSENIVHDENGLPYGERFYYETLDEEIKSAFSGHNLILVK